MSVFSVKKATRSYFNPLIGIYGESGCGKTYSALLLARGIVGETGKIVLIDTESGRGSLYSDLIPGGYDVIDFEPPFSPARFSDAMQYAIDQGANCLIIDSISHEWEGIGGVCDMAAAIEERTGKSGLHCWKDPKMQHAKLVLSMLRSSIPTIVCMRAKHKSKQVRNNGKTEIVKDDFATPIQDDGFIFEMTVHGEILRDHTFLMTKSNHVGLAEIFGKKKMLSIDDGKKVAVWRASGSKPTEQEKTDTGSEKIAVAKRRLWDLTKEKHGGDVQKLQQWLWDENVMDLESAEMLHAVGLDRLLNIIEKVESLV